MWITILRFFESAIAWLIVIGSLVLLHIVDSQLLYVPDFIARIANQIPREIYPFFYGALTIYALRPVQLKLTEKPLKKAFVFGTMAIILISLVKYADLPSIGMLNTRYVAIFLIVIFGTLTAICVARIIESQEAQKSEVPDTSLLEAKVAYDQLRTDLSWLWSQNNDSRNMELVQLLKFAMLVFILIALGGAILAYLLQLKLHEPSDEDFLGNIIIITVILWGIMFYAVAKVNRKYWAPNIDADKKLRKALGSQYDTELDQQLKTKSLKNLIDENWFIRMYSHVKEVKPDN